MQEVIDKNVDLQCYYSKDNEGNYFSEVIFESTALFYHDGYLMSEEDTDDGDQKVCCIN